MAWLENSVEQKALSLINMRLWRNGRRAGFRFQWATVEVQVLSAAPYKNCRLESSLSIRKFARAGAIFVYAARRKSTSDLAATAIRSGFCKQAECLQNYAP